MLVGVIEGDGVTEEVTEAVGVGEGEGVTTVNVTVIKGDSWGPRDMR